MATLYSAQMQLTRNQPPESIRTQDGHGRVRVQSFNWQATAAVASTDQVQLCVLPAGARVLSGYLHASSTLQSAAGVVQVGITGNLGKYMASTSSFSAATAGTTFANTTPSNYLNPSSTATTVAAQLTAPETILLSFQTSGATIGAGVYGHILYVLD